MPELEPQRDGIAAEITSNMGNEFVKAVALLKGMDPITASALGGAASGAIKSAHAAWEGAIRRRRERMMVAVSEASRVAGGRLDELLVAALDDDTKIELLIQALESAQRTADIRRVRFYGRIAAKGALAQDRASIDAAQRVFISLAALDPVDIKVLLHMARKTDHKWLKSADADGPSLAGELPEVRPVLDAVVARLEGQGLITSNAGSTFLTSLPTWWVTEYGLLCVKELLDPSQ
ncbi:hypothetical protein [Allokutzneria multivorans]